MYPWFLLLLLVPAACGIGCPPGCECNDDTFVVQCVHGRLDVIPITLNPAIQRLVLKSNRIRSVDSALQFYRDLRYIDLSSNHLVSIPSGNFLYQERFKITHSSEPP
ncbi:unnamed protein product [Callosobruchus maculatus]|uniref:LRRNT domain-containing protein n=1 Tax=Callosobruchus maculatus TaxID=64391 RepID=A0A653CK73_CALMS|nr:unnamed protein product [Callosobruchus maculatus]